MYCSISDDSYSNAFAFVGDHDDKRFYWPCVAAGTNFAAMMLHCGNNVGKTAVLDNWELAFLLSARFLLHNNDNNNVTVTFRDYEYINFLLPSRQRVKAAGWQWLQWSCG